MTSGFCQRHRQQQQHRQTISKFIDNVSLGLRPSLAATFTTMPVSLYDGLPLRNTEQETYLLTLLPGEDSLINCHLRITQLTDDIQYEALSCAWGDPEVAVPIQLHSQYHEVTTNLGAALLQLRHRSGSRTL